MEMMVVFFGMVGIGNSSFDIFQDLDILMGILILVLTLYFIKWDIVGMKKSNLWWR